MLAIRTTDLSKKYGKHTGVENINLEVEAGEIFGIFGWEGAGKTTLLRLLMNYIFPTSGTGNILGFDIVEETIQLKEITAYAPEEVTCYPQMKAGKYIKTAMKMHKLRNNVLMHKLIDMFEIPVKEPFEILERVDAKTTGLAGALVLNPKVLLLDQPTKDLDKEKAELLLDYLGEIGEEGMTIVITSDNLEELQSLCHRIAFLEEGKITEIYEINDDNDEENDDAILIYGEDDRETLYNDEFAEFEDDVDSSLEETQLIPTLATDIPTLDATSTPPLPLAEIETSPETMEMEEQPIMEEELAEEDSTIEEELTEDEEAIDTEESMEEETNTLSEDDIIYEEKSIEDFLAEPEVVATAMETTATIETPGDAPQNNSDKEVEEKPVTAGISATAFAETEKSVKVTAKRFNKKAFEAMGMVIMEEEKGKVKLAYAGDVEALATKMKEMGFADYSISNEELKEQFTSLQQDKQDEPVIENHEDATEDTETPSTDDTTTMTETTKEEGGEKA